MILKINIILRSPFNVLHSVLVSLCMCLSYVKLTAYNTIQQHDEDPTAASISADEPAIQQHDDSITATASASTSNVTIQQHDATVPSTSDGDHLIQQHSGDQPTKSTLKLYKLVVDNIDKTVKSRDMRSNVQTKSLHYVQMYSVKNRIDFLVLSQVPRSLNIDDSLYSILPSEEEYKALKIFFAILIARTIHEHIPFFGKDFKRLIPMHIPHQYADRMSAKSEVVSNTQSMLIYYRACVTS